MCRSFLCKGMRQLYLFRAAAKKNHFKSRQDDGQVQLKGEILDVIQLVLELALCIFDGGSILILDLRPAGDPWPDTVPAPVQRNHFFEHLAKLRLLRAGTYKTHLAA